MPLLSEDALNDFFQPAQDCIKPVEVVKTDVASEIRVDDGGVHWEVGKDGTETQLEKATISLNDCLACSGCVTTAESVLIGLQSWDEVANTLAAGQKKVLVASICPQSVASIAAAYSLTYGVAFRRLRKVFRDYGFRDLVSTNVGREVCLDAASREFCDGERARRRVRSRHAAEGGEGVNAAELDKVAARPLLASACPGWICYAEKQKSHVIPNISKVRSPQQMTGVMLKDTICAAAVAKAAGGGGAKIGRDDVYHVAVMPCFDKKLEASRAEFAVDEVRDVDTVVTGAEVVAMLQERGIDLAKVEEDNSPSTLGWPVEPGRQPGSSSGGYLAHVLVTAAKELYNFDINPEDLRNSPHVVVRDQRTPKLREYDVVRPAKSADGVTTGGSEVVLRFAEAYGFRQITSLTQKIGPADGASAANGRAGAGRGNLAAIRRRRNKAANGDGAAAAAIGSVSTTGKLAGEYDYVEVMACDRGCINGGGQVKPPDAALLAAAGLVAGQVADEPGLTNASDEDAAAAAGLASIASKTQLNKAWVDAVDAVYNQEPLQRLEPARTASILAWWRDTARLSIKSRPSLNGHTSIGGNTATAGDQTQDGEMKKAMLTDTELQFPIDRLTTTYNVIPPMINPLASKW